MVIMNIEVDNIFSFKDFSLNFSYPKKIVNSTIENEFLESKPKFRYKRLITIMGANGTGKSTLGKLFKGIFDLICKKELAGIRNGIKDHNKSASFSIDFLLDEDIMYRLDCRIYKDEIKLDAYASKILKTYSYEKAAENFFKIPLEEIPEFSLGEDEKIDEKVLSSIMKSLDSRRGIEISKFVSSMLEDNPNLYYCDEKFQGVHSDVEVTLLSVMVSLLPKNSQLFFTTHNLDVLDMNIPIHSFLFLRKRDGIIEAINPKDFIKKNDVSLRNAVRNDIFDIAPDVSSLYNLERIK